MRSIVEYRNGTGLWVVEFSQRQQAFHVQELDDAAVTNLGRFLSAQGCDYVPIGLGASRAQAGEICDALDVREDRTARFTPAEARRAVGRLFEMGLLQPAMKQAA
jgi:hypothetical protein